ncbi:MAG TPA: hypothetical protein VF173_09940 [Thermoanaerobaculia bacterium]|nr:hypothetical protein [Thermoanaerobaculia bacterium]
MKTRSLGMLCLLCLALAGSAFAADRAIQNGIDVWQTKGDGSTLVDFARNPIPAGFFCAGSSSFTGKVAFQGVPVATGTPHALGATDTIVQRLDDAVFNRRGVAVTRTQVRALSLKSVAPLQTECGQFEATVRLNGVQPITQMVIRREDANGGTFSGPLSLNVKVSFTPVGRVSREALEIPLEIRFPANAAYPWRTKVAAPVPAGFVHVDTDGDGVADTYLPGTSNFFAGQSGRAGALEKRQVCHDDGTGQIHCTTICNTCQIP